VTVSAAGESLSQLLYSVISTGYLFRNAQYRLELRERRVERASVPFHCLWS
jgi:hypothetical protein